MKRVKRIVPCWIVKAGLVLALIWMGGCARPTVIRTITEVKSVAQVEIHRAIPVLIESIEQGNRDVAYASLSVLGDFYKELIEKSTHEKYKNPKNPKNEEAAEVMTLDTELIEEFLVEYYDTSKNDFNHKNIILQSLSQGLYKRPIVSDFFKQVLAGEVNEPENSEVERAEKVGYGLTLIEVTLKHRLEAYESLEVPEAKALLETFNADFLVYCEEGLGDASNRVFEIALSCMMNFVSYSGANKEIARERVRDVLSEKISATENPVTPTRLFILKQAREEI